MLNSNNKIQEYKPTCVLFCKNIQIAKLILHKVLQEMAGNSDWKYLVMHELFLQKNLFITKNVIANMQKTVLKMRTVL